MTAQDPTPRDSPPAEIVLMQDVDDYLGLARPTRTWHIYLDGALTCAAVDEEAAHQYVRDMGATLVATVKEEDEP